jgi:hypothetical protein
MPLSTKYAKAKEYLATAMTTAPHAFPICTAARPTPPAAPKTNNTYKQFHNPLNPTNKQNNIYITQEQVQQTLYIIPDQMSTELYEQVQHVKCQMPQQVLQQQPNRNLAAHETFK